MFSPSSAALQMSVSCKGKHGIFNRNKKQILCRYGTISALDNSCKAWASFRLSKPCFSRLDGPSAYGAAGQVANADGRVSAKQQNHLCGHTPLIHALGSLSMQLPWCKAASALHDGSLSLSCACSLVTLHLVPFVILCMILRAMKSLSTSKVLAKRCNMQ